jgi:hypothetical protein
MKHTRLPVQRRVSHADVGLEYFYYVTFPLSDQQLIIGIGRHTAGLKLHADGTINKYPCSIVHNLAFFHITPQLHPLLALWTCFGSVGKQ